MRIGIITSSLAKTDGWGRYSLEMIKGLKGYHKVKVVCHEAQDMEGIESYPVLPFPTSNFLTMASCLPKIIKHLRDCDVIHCFVEPYAPVIALSNILLRKPFIITAVGTYAVSPLRGKGISPLLLKFAYKKADKIWCISRFTQQEILKHLFLKNTCVVNLGVAYDRFQNTVVHDDKVPTKRLMLSVGAIKPRKGFDISIKAFAQVKRDFPDLEYYIVGQINSQEFYKSLLEIASSSNVSKDIHFCQDVADEELIRLYQQADIFVLTPQNINDNFEGFGLVYLEANACGKPVIGSLDCGAEDAIIEGYNGLLVPQNDVDRTAQAIKYLFDNPEVAKKMGENAKRRAQELSWDNVIKQVLKIYEEVIHRRKR